jgi:hypothetical protein
MLKTVSSITNAIGALNYKGTWNASTNTPALASGVGTKGDYYVVSVAGSTALDGISNWGVGDWVAFNGTTWQRVEGGADLNGVNLNVSGTSTFSALTASKALFTDASKNLTSTGTVGTTQGGTGLTSFTANGVLYASGTGTLATSSYLTWDGATFKATTNANMTNAVIEAASLDAFSRGYLRATGSYQTQTVQSGVYLRWNDGSTTNDMAAAIVVNTGAAASTSSANWRFYTSNAGTLTESFRIDENQYLLVGYTGSNGAYRLQVNSQIFATSATIATSDGRYKENVEPLDNALDLVMKLNPVSFNWKQHPVHNFDYSTKTIGFIAQEVQETLKGTPYVDAIVKSNSCVIQEQEIDEQTGKVLKEEIREEFLGIAEGNLVALLNKAIQEQQQIIEQLSSRIAALEAAKTV